MFLDWLIVGPLFWLWSGLCAWIVHDTQAHLGGTMHLPVFAERDFGNIPRDLGDLPLRV